MELQIRKGMANDSVFLSGLVDADETLVMAVGGGKHNNDDPPERDLGAKRRLAVSVLAHGGKAVAEPSDKVTGKTLKAFLGGVVETVKRTRNGRISRPQSYECVGASSTVVYAQRACAHQHNQGLSGPCKESDLWTASSLQKRL